VLVRHLHTGVHSTPASSQTRGATVLTTAGDAEIQQQRQQLHTIRIAHTAQQQNHRDAASSRRTTAVAAVWQAAHAAVQHKHRRRNSTSKCMQKAVRLRGGSADTDNGVALEAQRSDCDEDSSSLLSPSQVLDTSYS
jgi:hypothetical protein